MSNQLDLPGFGSRPPPFHPDTVAARSGRPLSGYNLFMAIFPEPEEAAAIAVAARAHCLRHGRDSSRLKADRLHITLHTIASCQGKVPQEVVDAATAAANRVVCPPVPIAFDRILSFAGSAAFVLRCDTASDQAIALLRGTLGTTLRQLSLTPQPSASPHMTMLYAEPGIAEEQVEPLRWTATRFALILSHIGLTHHQWIGQWRLADRP